MSYHLSAGHERRIALHRRLAAMLVCWYTILARSNVTFDSSSGHSGRLFTCGGGGWRDDPGPRGRDGTGGKVRAVNDSRCSLRLVAPLCCVLLRATLAPTALAHDGDESDFVGLFSVLTDVASIVSWCHGFTSMTSMLVSPRRRNTQEYSRPSGPFLF